MGQRPFIERTVSSNMTTAMKATIADATFTESKPWSTNKEVKRGEAAA
jgi:hypothetical protein